MDASRVEEPVELDRSWNVPASPGGGYGTNHCDGPMMAYVLHILAPPVGDPAPPRNNFCELEQPPPAHQPKKKAKYRGTGGTGSAEVSPGQPGEWRCGKP